MIFNLERKIIICIIVLAIENVYAEDSLQMENPITLPSYFSTKETITFYGDGLTTQNFLGGYGGVDIRLGSSKSPIISAFFEVGGGRTFSNAKSSEEDNPNEEDSSSFFNLGSRLSF